VSRDWVITHNPQPCPGPNSAPVQSQLHRATGPAPERSGHHHACARRAVSQAGGHRTVARLKDYVAAAGTAVAVLLIVPTVLMAEPSARADTGMEGYLRCIDSAGVPPKPQAEDWSPTIKMIVWNLNNAESPTEVAQRLAAMGFKPNDAAAEVQCVITNVW
jgi:hypothetical protein